MGWLTSPPCPEEGEEVGVGNNSGGKHRGGDKEQERHVHIFRDRQAEPSAWHLGPWGLHAKGQTDKAMALGVLRVLFDPGLNSLHLPYLHPVL